MIMKVSLMHTPSSKVLPIGLNKTKKTTQECSHLTKLLIDDSKLESVVQFVLIKTDDQLRGLGRKQKVSKSTRRGKYVCQCLSIIQAFVFAMQSLEMASLKPSLYVVQAHQAV